MGKVVTSRGKPVANLSASGDWRWVDQSLAEPEFVAMLDLPELLVRSGGERKGLFYTTVARAKKGTKAWAAAVREVLWAWDLEYQE